LLSLFSNKASSFPFSVLNADRLTTQNLYRSEIVDSETVRGTLRHRSCFNTNETSGINEIGSRVEDEKVVCNHPELQQPNPGQPRGISVAVLYPPKDPVGMSANTEAPVILNEEEMAALPGMSNRQRKRHNQIFLLPAGSRVPPGIDIVVDRNDHATFSIASPQEVTYENQYGHEKFKQCYVTAISTLPWEKCGVVLRAGGELAPQWLRDYVPLAVLANALDIVVELSTDVDLTSDAFGIGEAMAEFNVEQVESADFRQKVLQPLEETLEAFLQGGDFEPDETEDILNGLQLLERVP
jgi:hypothetical protein